MKKFKKIYIEITDSCNLQCKFCSSVNRKNSFISKDRFQMLMQEVIPYTDHVNLHVQGEPLLHPQLKDLLDYCHSIQCKVNIVTNGIKIADVQEHLLKSQSLRQISFSLHCLEESLSNYPSLKYIQDILDFTEILINQTKVIVSYRFWNIEKKDTKLGPISLKILKRIKERFSLDLDLNEALTIGKGIKLKEQLYLNTDYKFVWPSILDNYHQINGFCYGMRDQAAVLLDGTVVPCCLDSNGIINLGNIYQQSFKSILESSRAKNIFQGFSERRAVEELCTKCSYKSRFDN